MGAERLRASALAMVDTLRAGKNGRGAGLTYAKPDEAAIVIEALVGVLDAYEPLVRMVNEAGEKSLQACIRVIEREPTLFWTDHGMEEDVDGTRTEMVHYIDRDDLLEELMRLNGYVEVDVMPEVTAADVSSVIVSSIPEMSDTDLLDEYHRSLLERDIPPAGVNPAVIGRHIDLLSEELEARGIDPDPGNGSAEA
jgi:hypothetical protein